LVLVRSGIMGGRMAIAAGLVTGIVTGGLLLVGLVAFLPPG
jgi:hypothetical protein